MICCGRTNGWLRCSFFLKGDHFTWVNDLILVIEAHSEMLSFPLGSLNIQVALLYGEGGDALVVSGVELGQVLPKEHILESGSFIAMDLKP